MQIINEIVVCFLDFSGLLHHNTVDRKGISADTILLAAHQMINCYVKYRFLFPKDLSMPVIAGAVI